MSPAEQAAIRLEPLRVEATGGVTERWRGLPSTHPEEGLPPEVVAVLGSASSAEPFLFYRNSAQDSDWPGDPLPVSSGHCIADAQLMSLVTALLDPNEYMYGTDFSHCYLAEDEAVPHLGLVIWAGADRVVLVSNRDFLVWTVVEPIRASPGGLFRPAVLSAIAKDSFPGAPWTPVDRIGWRPQQFWQEFTPN